jgi:predicted heme/steroid binding protein
VYNGEDPSKPIYVALNGSIYDVSAGANTYGPGGSYHFFAGKDAARAFITGCFQDDLTSDLRGVEEMYIPVDDPEEDAKLTKTELKIRRERERREAKRRVKEGIEGWAQVFRGETGRPYFQVGSLKKEEGELGPVRELCQAAKESRPKRGE